MSRVALLLLPLVLATKPSAPKFFDEQLVDHFSGSTATFRQRYYENTTSFGGAGHPIFLVVGGEGAIPPSTGIFYPWVTDVLAPRFKALVIEPEHRFYGSSLPRGNDFSNEALELLTPQQALADIATLLLATQLKYNCTAAHKVRCPVLTIGGSYPGFLSAMMRLRYPAIVDMAYAASAPLLFYAQTISQYKYYEVITKSAEKAAVGCADSVRWMLANTLHALDTTKADIVSELGLCAPLPPYIASGAKELLVEEIDMVVMYSFAGLNMENYPPGETALHASCKDIISARSSASSSSSSSSSSASSASSSSASSSSASSAAWTALADFLHGYSSLAKRGPRLALTLGSDDASNSSGSGCYNLSSQLPAGTSPTISAGDWSGVGGGLNGLAWDYETCTMLIEKLGTNNRTDMFPARDWTLTWLQQHCMARFGVTPQPTGRSIDSEW
jgi:pimeloyl-ACP methyl ester carboxylesterase